MKAFLTDKQVEEIKNYVSENLTDKKLHEKILAQFYWAKTYTSELFKEKTGFTIPAYIRKTRYGKVKELIEKGYLCKTAFAEAGLNLKDDYELTQNYVKFFGEKPSDTKRKTMERLYGCRYYKDL